MLDELAEVMNALEQARDDMTDALSQYGDDSPEYAAALDRVSILTGECAVLRRRVRA